ncbi:hypothetical protein EB73_03400 [Mycobacterium sp. SWH-M3]|nr:hypothetical protein EB73_03400 [Mycobacterium sp. SWH-M3]
MTQTRSTEVRGPSRQPCGSCPYRRDVASGIWAASEYAKLTAYDADTPFQPPNLFLCHQTAAEDHRARLCAGWVGCHGPDLLALRLAATTGQLATTDVRAAFDYTTTVPLFESGAAAATHGTRDIPTPGPRAQRAITKIAARRPDTHPGH